MLLVENKIMRYRNKNKVTLISSNLLKVVAGIIYVLTLSFSAFSQDFSFKLYLSDSLNNKDTLTIGYDKNASDSIDPTFGESNIDSTPFDSSLEVRSFPYSLADMEVVKEIYYFDPSPFHSKTQIVKGQCPPLLQKRIVLSVHTSNWPLKIKWSSNLFQDTCRNNSLLADWHPNLWFDASYDSYEGPYYLRSKDSVIFQNATHHYVDTSNDDTIDLLFLALADTNSNFTKLDDKGTNSNFKIKVFPNPAKNRLHISYSPSIYSNLISTKLYNTQGQFLYNINKTKSLNISNLRSGKYFIKFNINNSKYIVEQFIVN